MIKGGGGGGGGEGECIHIFFDNSCSNVLITIKMIENYGSR